MTEKHITIVCFAGPSGSGKTELVKRLLELYPDNVRKWKQATTRARRSADEDYVFVTQPQYDVMRTMLTCRTEFNGNSYGTFPEPLVKDVAVLTIADAAGLADLEQDVAEHNKRVQAGHPGKLGANPVKLVRVLMVYDLSDAEIEKRGGTRGGTRDASFLQNEVDRLRVFQFDSVVDSTGGWPDPVEFFVSVIWPAISSPFGGETADDLRQAIRALCGDIITASKGIEDLNALHAVRASLSENVLAYMDEWKELEPEPQDDIDALLTTPVAESDPNAAERAYSEGVARAEYEELSKDEEEDPTQVYATDYLNDRPFSSAPEDAGQPSEEAEAGAEAVVEADAPVATYEEAVQATEVAEEIIHSAAAEAPEPPAPVSLRSPAEIFTAVDITDWMMEQTIGMEAFESEHTFKTIFSQYVSANGGDPNGISVSSQATVDGKGGRVVDYVAHLPTGERYGLEFNERIKRATNYGPR